jgi:glycerate kinase
MRVVMVCEEWDGGGGRTLPASVVAQVAHSAWSSASPTTQVSVFALGNGGPRSADALDGSRRTIGGVEVVQTTTASGTPAVMLAPGAGGTRWSPVDLASGLLGLAAEARIQGRRQHVIVPVGNADCAGDATTVWGGGAEAMRHGLASLEVTVLVTTDRPLLGFHGMSSALRDGREADAAVAVAAQQQEQRWTEIARLTDPALNRTSLIGSSRLSDQPGTGAASGLAYCLAASGARIVTDAAAYLAEAAGVTRAIEAGAAIAVALTPTLTPSTLDHGLARSLAQAASAEAIPTVVIAPEVHVGKRDLMNAGLAAAYEAGAGLDALRDQLGRVAQTWTPSH